ncbi:hypothetical protein SOM11_04605 [Frigoribacterium sp. CFBP9039]|uniref:hypothetical protein n=1 Tax=Frigoribacterium sp. CFBP9029 TaxID=3096541 RepID=UPI002A6A1EC0|nr:hypothetical protein [Frigoribacterium sp. CFBP9039]MDY0945263.1 hypothetical protein [Frigoribacterium sp. CFBP9039]
MPEETFGRKPEKKGQKRLKHWLVRVGVPGSSLLAPLARPNVFTAATLTDRGLSKGWVMLGQADVIVLYTSGLAMPATGMLSVLGS